MTMVVVPVIIIEPSFPDEFTMKWRLLSVAVIANENVILNLKKFAALAAFLDLVNVPDLISDLKQS